MQEKCLIEPTFLKCSEKSCPGKPQKIIREILGKFLWNFIKELSLVCKSRHTTPLESLILVNRESICMFICNLKDPACNNLVSQILNSNYPWDFASAHLQIYDLKGKSVNWLEFCDKDSNVLVSKVAVVLWTWYIGGHLTNKVDWQRHFLDFEDIIKN